MLYVWTTTISCDACWENFTSCILYTDFVTLIYWRRIPSLGTCDKRLGLWLGLRVRLGLWLGLRLRVPGLGLSLQFHRPDLDVDKVDSTKVLSRPSISLVWDGQRTQGDLRRQCMCTPDHTAPLDGIPSDIKGANSDFFFLYIANSTTCGTIYFLNILWRGRNFT